jgi:hypothetical protein
MEDDRMSVEGKHGVTAATPGNILLGAGTYHKNLKYTSNKWGGEIIGATNGGGKVSIKGELKDLEVDGALVKIKGMTVKQGGAATMEAYFAEIKTDLLKMATLFEQGTDSSVTGYTMLQDKPNIEEGDYVPNFGFVGVTANDKKKIIVIFENALCTSGLDLDPKNKDQAVLKVTMEACANIEGDLNVLPVKIYYPDAEIA